MKYSANAECEIIHCVNCEISHFVRCEMKFTHIRVSEYFTAKLFHLGVAKFHSPQADFVEKSTSATQMCFFLARVDKKDAVR